MTDPRLAHMMLCAICQRQAEFVCACGKVRYCSAEHQLIDWPRHKVTHTDAVLLTVSPPRIPVGMPLAAKRQRAPSPASSSESEDSDSEFSATSSSSSSSSSSSEDSSSSSEEDEDKTPKPKPKPKPASSKQHAQPSQKKGLVRWAKGFTTYSTGARAGELIEFISDGKGGGEEHSAAPTVLRVVEGDVTLHADVVDHEVARKLALVHVCKYLGDAPVAEAIEYMREHAGESGQNNADPMGKRCRCSRAGCKHAATCKFVIVQPGILLQYATEAEDIESIERLNRYVEERTPVDWRAILACVGKHHLVLRRAVWRVSQTYSTPARWEGTVVWVPSGRCGHVKLGTTPGISRSDISIVNNSPNYAVCVDDAAEQHPPLSGDTATRVLALARDSCRQFPDVWARETEFAAAVAATSAYTAGELKAAMQKAIRFCAPHVRLVDAAQTLVRTEVCTAVVAAQLMLHPGSFNPDLGIFARGCTSAFKRIGVITFEDALPFETMDAATDRPSAAALMAAAVLSARHEHWVPSRALMVWAVRVAVMCARSRVAGHRMTEVPVAAAEAATARLMECTGANETHFGREDCVNAAVLLRLAKSFRGDLNMFAQMASRPLRLLRAAKTNAVMPVEHIVDQHAFAGIGHMISDGDLVLMEAAAGDAVAGRTSTPTVSTYTRKFRRLFDDLTGTNPRRAATHVIDETSPAVIVMRKAQRRCYLLRYASMTRMPTVAGDASHVAVSTLNPTAARMPIPVGELAAAYGPKTYRVTQKEARAFAQRTDISDSDDGLIHDDDAMDVDEDDADEEVTAPAPSASRSSTTPAKKKKPTATPPVMRMITVMIGVDDPNAETAVVAPSRSTSGIDLYTSLPTAYRLCAISKLRKEGPKRIVSPLGFTGTVQFINGTWCLDGRPWVTDALPALVAARSGERVLVHPAVPAGVEMADAACTEWGDGIREDGLELARGILSVQTLQTVLRIQSLLSGSQHSTLEMPVPARSGKRQGADGVAYDHDSAVFHALLAISACVPGALRADVRVPRFVIPNAALFRIVAFEVAHAVEQLLMRKTTSSTAASADRTAADKFAHALTCAHALYPCQQLALDDMVRRDTSSMPPRAHFLYMNTGAGKTLTALSYVRSIYTRHPDHPPRYVVWTFPGSDVGGVRTTIQNDIEGGATDVTAVLTVTPPSRSRSTTPRRPSPTASPGATSTTAAAAAPVTLTPFRINLIPHDTLREVVDHLASTMHETVFVVDECHKCYNATLRTAATTELARLARTAVFMTATPLNNTNATGYVNMIQMCVPYSINAKNWIVAASAMVTRILDYPITVERIVRRIPIPPGFDYRNYAARAIAGSDGTARWGALAAQIYDRLMGTLVDTAIEYAHDGVLLVADTAARAEALRAALNACAKVRDGPITVLTAEQASTRYTRLCANKPADDDGCDHNLIAIVQLRHALGFNWGARLGAIVTSEYPGGASAREQLMGRIRRSGQMRSTVSHITVLMQDTIVEALYDHHQNADQMNFTFEELGKWIAANQ